jgi:hypothetical protein
MAHSTLAVSSETLTGNLIDNLFAIVEQVASRAEHTCCGESAESSAGACDGGEPCRKTATIHDPRTGESWCVGCFEGVILG